MTDAEQPLHAVRPFERLGILATGYVHDLSNDVTSLVGALENFKAEVIEGGVMLTPEGRSCFEFLTRAVSRIADDIRDFSRERRNFAPLLSTLSAQKWMDQILAVAREIDWDVRLDAIEESLASRKVRIEPRWMACILTNLAEQHLCAPAALTLSSQEPLSGGGGLGRVTLGICFDTMGTVKPMDLGKQSMLHHAMRMMRGALEERPVSAVHLAITLPLYD